MIVRKANVDDAERIIDLHLDTVRRVNSADYTPAQIDAWLGKRKVETTRAMIRQGLYYVCALENGTLCGFGCLQRNELLGLYVSADRLRQGIGSQLLARMEADAVQAGHEEMAMEATLTAVPFYRSKGYAEVARKRLAIADGQYLDVVSMRKALTHPQPVTHNT
jgi:GNAT superfamily N-acetyltransferase